MRAIKSENLLPNTQTITKPCSKASSKLRNGGTDERPASILDEDLQSRHIVHAYDKRTRRPPERHSPAEYSQNSDRYVKLWRQSTHSQSKHANLNSIHQTQHEYVTHIKTPWGRTYIAKCLPEEVHFRHRRWCHPASSPIFIIEVH